MQAEISIPTPAPSPKETATVPHFSDPAQSRLTVRLSTICIAQAVMLIVAIIIIAVMWYRGPIVVLMRQTPQGDEVFSYNGQPVASLDKSVMVAPDSITEGNKTLIARMYVEWLYGSDAGNRARNVESALRLMVDGSAEKLMACMNRSCPEMNLDLATKRREGWQEQWTPQEVALDARDPFTVNLIGQQKVTKTVTNEVLAETKQIRVSVKLVADPEGRTDRNYNNGVRVASYDYRELTAPAN